MNKFYDVVGYGETVESPSGSGVWVDEITEYSYFGDVVRNIRRNDSADSVNTDLTVSNAISVVADQYANENFSAIRYVRWNGIRWTVTTVDASKPPRLILNLGKVYNGPTP